MVQLAAIPLSFTSVTACALIFAVVTALFEIVVATDPAEVVTSPVNAGICAEGTVPLAKLLALSEVNVDPSVLVDKTPPALFFTNPDVFNPDNVSPVNVGDDAVARSCGPDNVIVFAPLVTVTRFAVPLSVASA